MCGIVGYIGKEQNSSILINALKELEYRGYDSCGIVTDNGQEKKIGPPTELTLNVPFKIGIGHTRWATHGSVSLENTHPIQVGDCHVVCNGIIENSDQLRTELIEEGMEFTSETDTEVIGHLFNCAKIMQPKRRLIETVMYMNGAYSFLLYNKDDDFLYYANQGSPLNIYYMDGGMFVSSSDIDIPATHVYRTNKYDIGIITKDGITVDNGLNHVNIKPEPYYPEPVSLKLEGYSSYMEKEIYEQPEVIKNTIKSFYNFDFNNFIGYDSFTLIGCGSSYNACLVGKYFLELAGIPCQVELASEFSGVVHNNTLLIAVSQSGETADTLKAYRDYSGKKIGICNSESTMSRLGDTVFLDVGVERGVASTKTFAAQCYIFYKLPIILKGGIDCTDAIEDWLKWDSNILDDLPERVKDFKKFAFIGSGMFYPLALEGALKFKELTYIPAQGYAAGEMKHGPLALADEDLCVFSLGSNPTAEAELCARGAYVIVSPGNEIWDFFQTLVQVQLTAMLVASKMGHDVDKPRNLAKSVTVK